MRCSNCNYEISKSQIYDRDLPPINRTEANLWKAEALEYYKELVKAGKGIRRLKKREAYLLECIKKNNEYFGNHLEKVEFKTIIKTEEQYRTTLAECERLIALDPKKDTPDGDRLELLALLVEDYEKKYFPI